ncbi:MAG: T9SS type A sorting domain-containing protein [Chitinophagales bacterium]|nr:T9SS type A sorting domain-containing protein [Chitinophagales bacterium]
MIRSSIIIIFSLFTIHNIYSQACDTTITGPVIDGATVSSNLGNTLMICAGDGIADSISMSNTSLSTEDYIYVVTTPTTEVLAISNTGVLDFENAGAGDCWIWGLNYTGSILFNVGDTLNTFGSLTDSCFDLSDDYVLLQRTGVDGATVTSDLGDTLYTCVGDGIVDQFTMSNTSTASEFYVYIVTTPEMVISTISIINTYNFEGTGPGQLLVWGLSFSGSLLISSGDTLSMTEPLSAGCYSLSQNFVLVNKTLVDGAAVTSNFGDSLKICAGDGLADSVVMSNSSVSTEDYAYVITSPQSVVLGVNGSGIIDFETAGGGECWVWGLSYTGSLNIGLGDTVSTFGALSDSCYQLSDNFVVVMRTGVEGGSVASHLGDTVYTCVGDGNADSVIMSSSSTSTELYTYIVTNASAQILAISSSNILDFETAGLGECRVYGLSYTGNILVTPGNTIQPSTVFSDSCFSLSSNYIVVRRTQPDGATVSSNFGDTLHTCAGDGVSDAFIMSNSTTSNSLYTYVVTNAATEVLAVSSDTVFDFELAGEGECWVWGLSYTGSLLVSVGDTVLNLAALSDDCFDLSSNYVVVNRTGVDGAQVSSSLGDTLNICAGDGIGDPFVMSNTSTSSATYIYLITDASTNVLAINTDGNLDLDGAGAGECWVWGLSYTGTLAISVGDTVSTFGSLSDSCYGLSENYVVVFRSFVEGATVNSSVGDSAQFCTGDGFVDQVIMNNSSSSSDDYIYIITDASTQVLSIDTSGFLDFNNAGGGECWVWGLSYSGDLLISVGDTVSTFGALSDQCYDLSANFIVVERTEYDGGTVSILGGGVVDTICIGEGVEDTIYFDHSTTSSQQYSYIITDDNNLILAFATEFATFETAGVGVCRVYGVNYSGSLIAVPTDDVTAVFLSDSCWDLSSNYIEIVRENCSGISDHESEKELIVYPNPASSSITVTGVYNQTVSIYDLNGRIVFNTEVSKEHQLAIDISHLAPAVYAVKSSNGLSKLIVVE